MDSRLERLQSVLGTAMAGMTSEQLSWHPPGKWCVAEVLEHLYLTYTGTVKGFGRVDEAGKSLATAATFSHRWRTFVLLDVGYFVGYFPTGRKAPPVAQPRGLPPEKVVSEVGLKIAEMDEIIARCAGKLGSGKLLDHPMLGPLTAEQWRKFHLAHGLHHAKQIRALRESCLHDLRKPGTA
jgi:hypothetical protein